MLNFEPKKIMREVWSVALLQRGFGLAGPRDSTREAGRAAESNSVISGASGPEER